MSLEAFGDEGDGFDVDILSRHGWESNEDGDKWWRECEPDTVYTTEEAIRIYTDYVDDFLTGDTANIYDFRE